MVSDMETLYSSFLELMKEKIGSYTDAVNSGKNDGIVIPCPNVFDEGERKGSMPFFVTSFEEGSLEEKEILLERTSIKVDVRLFTLPHTEENWKYRMRFFEALDNFCDDYEKTEDWSYCRINGISGTRCSIEIML